MVAIVSLTLLAIIWPQPYIQLLSMFDVFSIMWATASAAIKTITRAWTHVYVPYQLAIILIWMMLYSNANTQRKYGPWPGTGWIWSTSMSITSSIGDWIVRVSQPSPTGRRQQRIQHAITTHRAKSRALIALTVMAMQVNATIARERGVRFDTDSANIGIDNRCTACISHIADDFEPGTLRKCNRVVKGFGGSRETNVQVGTLLWRWEDNQGIVTEFRIPNSYYVPAGRVRLLSPQHWAQTQATTRAERARCHEHTDGNACTLSWGDGKHKRTIPLGRDNNVATFSLAPGYSNFEAFCIEADLLDSTQDPIPLPSGIISDDEESTADIRSADEADMETANEAHSNDTSPPPMDDDPLKTTATLIEFNLDGPTTSTSEGGKTAAASTSGANVIIDEEDRQPSHLAELLRMHHQHGHISMHKIQEMARQGAIPKRLATCRIPTCSACLYSKATKRPWRGKESKRGDGR